MRNWFLAWIDSEAPLWFDAGLKSFLLLSLLAACATSCTTLSNRRDLYSPTEDAGPYNSFHPKKSGATVESTARPGNPLPYAK